MGETCCILSFSPHYPPPLPPFLVFSDLPSTYSSFTFIFCMHKHLKISKSRFHMYYKTYLLPFWVWLTYLNVLFSISTHFSARHIASFFLWLSNLIVCTYTTSSLSTYLLTECGWSEKLPFHVFISTNKFA